MTRSEVIRRLGALREYTERGLGTLLAELEAERGKKCREADIEIDGCDVCGVEDWRRCTCDPDAPEHVALMRRLDRSEG